MKNVPSGGDVSRPVLLGALVVVALLGAACFLVPGFGLAFLQTMECIFAPYTCVKVLP